MKAKDIGNYGEDMAVKFLLEKGYEIIERNFLKPFGEIDIIALAPADKNSSTPILVFLEVKTRRDDAFGDPLEAITPTKCWHMRKAAVAWLAQHHTKTPQIIRFDAIGMIVCNFRVRSLTHVRRIL